MSLDVFERAINEVSDKDWSWWPFLWLRPEKHADLALGRMISISILYGVPCGALFGLMLALARPEMRPALPIGAAAFPLLFLFLGSVLVAPMWNRRAERLRTRGERRPEGGAHA